MNLVLAKVVDQPTTGSACRSPATLALPDSVIAERPGAEDYVGKDVAVGVRSEDMEDGTLSTAPADRRMKGQVALTEALGSQIIVHFTFPGAQS